MLASFRLFWLPYILLGSLLVIVAVTATVLIIRLRRRRRRLRENLKTLSRVVEKGRFAAHPGGFLTWSVNVKRTVWTGLYQGRKVEISWTKEADNQFFEYHVEAKNPVIFFLSGWYGKQHPGRKRVRLLGRDLTFDCPDESEERTRLLLASEDFAERVLELQWQLIERPASGFIVFGDPQRLTCWKGLAVRKDRISTGECPPKMLLRDPRDFDPDEIVEIFDRLIDIHERLGRAHAAWE